MKKILDKTELFLNRIGQRLAPYFPPAVISTLMVFFVAIFLLFLPNYAGIADNGTFSKLIYHSGLYPLKGYEQMYTNYFVREYGILEYFNETGLHWVSSQSIVVNLAVFLNKIFYSKTIFDLRCLALIYLGFYLGAIYLLTKALTIKSRTKMNYLIAVIIGFIFSDSDYLVYFQSFYPNAVALISYIYMFSAGILLYRKMYSDKWLLLIYVSGAFFLLTLSAQYLFVVALSLIPIIMIGFMDTNISTRLLAMFAVLFLVISGVLSYLFIPLSDSESRHFQAVSQGVLQVTQQPKQGLEKMEINPQYGVTKGDNYFDEYLPYDSQGTDVKDNLINRGNNLILISYYFTNPKEFKKALSKSMRMIYEVQDASLGNFEKSVGRAPGAKSSLFSFYSEVRRKSFPKTLGFLNLFFLLVVSLYMPGFIKSIYLKDIREGMRFMLVLIFYAIALLNLSVVTMTFGFNGISTHLFLVPLTLDLLLLLTVSEFFNKRLFKTRQEQLEQGKGDLLYEKVE
ncbi:hypothetical protein [Enterococcus rivorum]|uniref:Glycosyltransferase RgtA/B/C/D-like domain-containing protein n=1 Tax=Enterococcus rivorum TaxID=762845 RepID=A0A1E5L0P1_9ENTE|nr:hypothetical protein [Enterococcus rivorum]MBP2098460.1 hypothetical protein [Enterococcus rivorum]OEH83688.1 hypothetical protein BCR26_08455 [Enterococcus rivorum]